MAALDLRTPEALARAVDEAAAHYQQGRLDDADKISALEALGVDGVITNDPRLFDPLPG